MKAEWLAAETVDSNAAFLQSLQQPDR